MSVTPYYQPAGHAMVPYPAPAAPAPVDPPARGGDSELDSWTQVLATTAELAQKIANTEFVPKEMRGNPAAVTAAMLTGRELGIGPMTALAHIHVVKGKPGQSAQLMRQLVLSAGHSIRYIETNDTRCIVEGRRRGEDQWERVAFTADQAKKAGIVLGGYPEDKLVARATARLCRRKFADCIGGMPYTTEELADGDADLEDPAAAAPAEPKKRTARRRTPTTAGAKPAASAPPADEPAGDNDAQEPALPGEDGYDPPAEPEKAEKDDNLPSGQQNRKMHALFHEADLDDRDDRLKLTSIVLGREIKTSAELTRAEASSLIDQLETWAKDGHLADHAHAVLHGNEPEGS